MSSHKCTTCGNPAKLTCPQCQTSGYCSQDCFQKDWPKHKQFHHQFTKDILKLKSKPYLHSTNILSKMKKLNNVNVQGKGRFTNGKRDLIHIQNKLEFKQYISASTISSKNDKIVIFGGRDYVFIYEIQENGILKEVNKLEIDSRCSSLLSLKGGPSKWGDLIVGTRRGLIYLFRQYFAINPNRPIILDTHKQSVTSLVEVGDSFFSLSGKDREGFIINWDYKDITEVQLSKKEPESRDWKFFSKTPTRHNMIGMGFYSGSVKKFSSPYILYGGGYSVGFDEKRNLIPYFKFATGWNLTGGFGNLKILSRNFVFGGTEKYLVYAGLENGDIVALSLEKYLDTTDIKLKGHQTLVTYLAISNDKRYLFSCSAGDNTLRVWDLTTNENIQTIKINIHVSSSLVFTASNQLILSSGKTVTVFSMKGSWAFQIKKETTEKIDLINERLITSIKIQFTNDTTFEIPSYFLKSTQMKTVFMEETTTLNPIQIYLILLGYPVQFTNPKQYFEMYLIFYHLKMWDYCYIIVKKLNLEVEDLGTLLKLFRISVQYFEEFGIFSLNLFIIFKNRSREINRSKALQSILKDLQMLKVLETFKQTRLELHPDLKNLKFPILYPEISQNRMKRLFKKKTGSNFILISGKDFTRIKVHKEVLILKSSFFYRLLKFPGKHFQQGVLIIDGFNSKDLNLLLEFIYFDEFSELPNLRSSIKLLIHSEAYFEENMKSILLKRIENFKNWERLRYLLEFGNELKDLSEKYQKKFFTFKLDLVSVNQFIFHSKQKNV